MEKGNKRIINSWAFYDWANSSYPLVITSAIFPIFYSNVAVHSSRLLNGKMTDFVYFFGKEFINTEFYSYVFAASFLVVSVLAPLLSGIADYSGRKKLFLQIFCYLGATSCAGLYFFNMEYFEWSVLLMLLGSIGFWGSIVFYNAFLPEIAEPKDHDRISAKGYTLGYIGSVILLVSNLVAIQVFEMNARWSFLTVGIWWAGFAQYTYWNLPETRRVHKEAGNILTKGFRELYKVWKEFRTLIRLKRYLWAYFVYSMGVQTVMLMAVIFANAEIDWPEGDKSGLIISIIIIQLIASVGAYFFSWMSKKTNNLTVLKVVLFIWVFVCMLAYFIHTPVEFYILAAIVGFVMGGVQSMSRSTYAKFLPETKDTASYFSFYDVLEKLGIVVGMFSFGFIQGITGDMRNSVLVIILFFVVGFILLLIVPKNEQALANTASS